MFSTPHPKNICTQLVKTLRIERKKPRKNLFLQKNCSHFNFFSSINIFIAFVNISSTNLKINKTKRVEIVQIVRKKKKIHVKVRQIPRKTQSGLFKKLFSSQKILVIFSMFEAPNQKGQQTKIVNRLQITRKSNFFFFLKNFFL